MSESGPLKNLPHSLLSDLVCEFAPAIPDSDVFYKTPDAVLQRQLTGYDTAAATKSEGNALFKEIEALQKAFAARAVKWNLDTNVNRRMANDH